MAESNNQFIEEDISEYMSGEELEKIITYICKKFDVIEDYDSNFDNVDHVANRELVHSLFKKSSFK